VQRAVFGYLNVAVQRLRIAACHPKAAGPQLTPVRIWHEEIGFADITQNRGERMSAIVKSAQAIQSRPSCRRSSPSNQWLASLTIPLGASRNPRLNRTYRSAGFPSAAARPY
jgi:hypothetical protein